MPKYIKPISISDFPATVSTNCFGFAIGDTKSYDTTFITPTDFNMDGNFPIAKAFHKTLSFLGYDELPRQISSLEEAAPNEYVFMIFWNGQYLLQIPFSEEREKCWNYHIVRRELDGTWVHKPGWEDKPCQICTDADWEAIYQEFTRKHVLFAVVKK